MAQLLRVQIAVLFGLLALSVTATARPCRTFLISSYSFSFPAGDHPADSATVTTFTEIRSFIPFRIAGDNAGKPSFAAEIFIDRALPAGRAAEEEAEEVLIEHHRPSQIRGAPFWFSAYDFSSLRDRTKDILSVVVALLFGLGCGALTAATMYLVWSMFSGRYDYHASYDDYLDGDDDGEGDDKIESPKKMGYVKIPAPEAPAKEAAV